MKDRIQLAIFEAEHGGDIPFLRTLKLILTVLGDRHQHQHDYSEQDCYAVIEQIASYHQECLTIFEESGAAKKAAEERAMIKKLKSLMPCSYSEDNLYDVVTEKITACGARSIRDLKQVMTLLRRNEHPGMDYGRAKVIAVSLLK